MIAIAKKVIIPWNSPIQVFMCNIINVMAIFPHIFAEHMLQLPFLFKNGLTSFKCTEITRPFLQSPLSSPRSSAWSKEIFRRSADQTKGDAGFLQLNGKSLFCYTMTV